MPSVAAKLKSVEMLENSCSNDSASDFSAS
ncbi:MAG: hypothetical protein ACI8Z1_002951 [Candidatus Azotimanducaceae bacterium]|jgi:hypothetical protein